MNDDIWFGYHVPSEGLNFESMKKICLTAEDIGLDLFTTTDHFMNMMNPSGKENHPLECWSLLAGLAAVTKKIRLGPLVSCYGYRAPTLLAKIATSVDIISNGRLIMGLGAGWHQAEFNGFYGRFPPAKERIQGFEDTLAIVHSMLRNEYTTYKGNVFSVENTLNSPLPVQKEVPIMTGVFGNLTIKIASRYADIIHCVFDPSLDALEDRRLLISERCKELGRDANEVRIAAGYTLWLNPTKEDISRRAMRLKMRGNKTLKELKKFVESSPSTPEAHIEAMQELINRGLKVFTFMGSIDNLKIFGEQILPKLR
ncbi:MAG: LLM class flavin-dependent oxidoreductase [Candidatus Lokiarchaeota archaeon]|nr:LLM class flavin-dependent oxidoreductase [Candidatus Lokiarchaeota archaeon]